MSPADLTAKLEELHAAAFGWALSCCGWDRSAAEDVLQATYLKLLDGRARFDGRSTVRTFVFGVIARTAREARRRAALRRWLPLAALGLGPEAVDGRPDPAAALAGVSVGTARTHYERGKAALRTLLGEERE